MKQDSAWLMSWERHVSCRILHDPICYSPNPEVVYLTISEWSRVLKEVLRMGRSLNWIFLWIPARMIWYVCNNSYGDILLIKVSFRCEVVTSGIVATSVFDICCMSMSVNLRICRIRWWICESSPCHTSSIWPWSDTPKVPLYGT